MSYGKSQLQHNSAMPNPLQTPTNQPAQHPPGGQSFNNPSTQSNQLTPDQIRQQTASQLQAMGPAPATPMTFGIGGHMPMMQQPSTPVNWQFGVNGQLPTPQTQGAVTSQQFMGQQPVMGPIAPQGK